MRPARASRLTSRSLAPLGALAAVAAVLATAPAHADGPGTGTSDGPAAAVEDPQARRLVELLLGKEWRLAQTGERELIQLGPAGARAALAARARTRSARERDRLERVVRAVVEALIAEIGRPVDFGVDRGGALAQLGDVASSLPVIAARAADPAAIGSDAVPLDVPVEEREAAAASGREDPKTAGETRARARAARAALASIGAAGLGLALEVPPLREAATENTIKAMTLMVFRHRADLLATGRMPDGAKVSLDEARNRVASEIRGNADLALPILALGIGERLDAARRVFQDLRDEAIEGAMKLLDADDPDLREGAVAGLFRLSELARPTLEKVARSGDASPEARLSAERLARRIRFHVSDALLRKIGHSFEDWDALPFHARRHRSLELARLGGPEAIPSLRALLHEDPSDDVRAVCAVSLFRLGDWVGGDWLRLHGIEASARISKEELARIYNEQGCRYLQLGNFPKAERELKKGLEIQPRSDLLLYNLACVYSRWGKIEEAFDYLRRAIKAGFDDNSHMDKDSDLDNIRDDPRYKELIDGIKKKKSDNPGGDD